MKKVLCVSNIDWNFSWQRAQSFMSGLAEKNYSIAFLNNTGFAKLKFSDAKRVYRRLFKKNGVVFPVPENIKVFSPLVIPPGLPLSAHLNKLFFYPNLFRLLENEGFNNPDIVYTYLPTQLTLSLIEILKPKRVVYDYVGDFFSHPRRPKDLENIHSKLLSFSDLILTDSDHLKSVLDKTHPNVHVLHNGVSEHFFNIKPTQLAETPCNLCYFGTIDSQTLDFNLISTLADQGYKITLIGILKGRPPTLHPNIILKKMMPLRTLAEELEKQDVIIFPYNINNFNRSVMPAKIYQSLASSRPIVSIGLPLLYNPPFSDLVHSATNHKEFQFYIKNIHNSENKTKTNLRRNLAEKNRDSVHLARLLDLLSKVQQ